MSLSRVQITRKVQHISGSAVAGATATVYLLPEYGTPTIYSAETGTAIISQPLIADSSGNINGWVELGDYSIVVESSSGSVTQRFYANNPNQSYLQTYGSADIPLTVKANSIQSNNTVEFHNSSGSVLASIHSSGSVASPTMVATQGLATALQGTVNSTYGLATALQGSATALQTSAGSVQTYLDNVLGTANAAFGSVSFFSGKETTFGQRLGTIEASSWVTTTRISDGAVSLSNFAAAVGTPEISLLATQTFTSSQSYILPGSAKIFVVEVTGAGGGGGGGGKNNWSGGNSYGGGGGAGGQRMRQVCTRAELSGTVTVTVGSGGSGGAGATTSSANSQGGIGNAGGWSQFGPIYVPGARPASGATGGNQREFGLIFGNGGYGGSGGFGQSGFPSYSAPSTGYRNFRGAAGGGGGAGIYHGGGASSGAAGGKGFDIPSNVWPTTSTPNVTVAQGGATGSAGDGGSGGNSDYNFANVGGAGVAPGGGGGGGGSGNDASSINGAAGGAGARGEVKIWVFG